MSIMEWAIFNVILVVITCVMSAIIAASRARLSARRWLQKRDRWDDVSEEARRRTWER